jgi:inhibitor of KinA sporulation pathway (predicted exonuclease)
MVRYLDKIIVVDVEATCWEDREKTRRDSEIIEIGVCFLDVKIGKITDNRGIIVRPESSEVSEYCTELTTLTQDMVNNGVSFRYACDILMKEYQSRKHTWASYGQYDWFQFRKECEKKNVPYPFSSCYINIKNLFALMNKLGRERGMAKALGISNIKLEGTHHRGKDDAYNIAKILRKMLERS